MFKNCKLSARTAGGALPGVSLDDKQSEIDDSFPNIFEQNFFSPSEIWDYESKHERPAWPAGCLLWHAHALKTNFNLGEKGSADVDISDSVSTT